MRHISSLNRSSHELYSEAEAAAMLGISIARLHDLLDQHVFTGSNERPARIEFASSDLLLLAYWNNSSERPLGNNVIQMPKRH